MSSHYNIGINAQHTTEPPNHHTLNEPSRRENELPAGIHTNPSPKAELTALATHLRRLADRLDRLEITQAASVEQLAVHDTHIQQFINTSPATPQPPINWPALTADQATDAWENLATWIAHVLVPWYDTTRDQLPDCWPLHRPAVMELSWLYTTYTEAFHSSAAAHHAADWHTRWRPAAFHRLDEIIPRCSRQNCGSGHHLTNPKNQIPHRPPRTPDNPDPPPPTAARQATRRTPPLATLPQPRHHRRPHLANTPRPTALATPLVRSYAGNSTGTAAITRPSRGRADGLASTTTDRPRRAPTRPQLLGQRRTGCHGAPRGSSMTPAPPVRRSPTRPATPPPEPPTPSTR